MKLRNAWMIRLAAFSAAGLVRAWLATVRARARSEDGRVHPPDPTVERLIYAFWHESFLGPAKIRTPVKVLISQSADGELIAQVCKHLGLGTIRGSSKRGGAQALLQLLRDGENTHLAITPDGPRGPRRQVKTGVVLLASLTGLPIVPLGVGFTRAWRFRSWDRFAIPRPFSTIAGVLGEPLIVPPDLDNAGVEQQRRRIEDAMLAATGAAEEWAERISAGHSQEAEGQRITPHAAEIRWQVGVRPNHESLVDTLFREKGTGPFCRNGPEGASHKRGLSPFRETLRNLVIKGVGERWIAKTFRHCCWSWWKKRRATSSRTSTTVPTCGRDCGSTRWTWSA